MDNIEKGYIVNRVFEADKESARVIIDDVIKTDGDDQVFINELERLYSEK